MQGMVIPREHLINSEAPPAGAALEKPRASPAVMPAGALLSCQVVDALAGDCRSALGARLRSVEAQCGFGTRCSRGCADLAPSGHGFAGAGRVRFNQVARAAEAGKAVNDAGF